MVSILVASVQNFTYLFVYLLMLKNKYLNIYLLICWNQNQQKNIDFENDQQIQQINICWKSENIVKIRKKESYVRNSAENAISTWVPFSKFPTEFFLS